MNLDVRREIAGQPVWWLTTLTSVLGLYYAGLVYSFEIAEWTWRLVRGSGDISALTWGVAIGWGACGVVLLSGFTIAKVVKTQYGGLSDESE